MPFQPSLEVRDPAPPGLDAKIGRGPQTEIQQGPQLSSDRLHNSFITVLHPSAPDCNGSELLGLFHNCQAAQVQKHLGGAIPKGKVGGGKTSPSFSIGPTRPENNESNT